MTKYSVPAQLIGRRVQVSLRAPSLRVFDGRILVARDPRIVERVGGRRPDEAFDVTLRSLHLGGTEPR